MAKVKYYGVKRGLVPGVYTSWDECKAQVDGFSGAEYKSFKTEEEANDYVNIEKDNVDDKNIEKDNEQALIDMGICYTAVPESEFKSKESVEPDVSKSDDDLDKPYAFVDGSFNPDTGVYGYGGYLFDGTTKYPLQGHGRNPEMASMRNVAGEIEGSMAAVRKAEELGIREMTMFYDYQGIEQWATGQWKTNNDSTRAYAEFMKSDNRSVSLSFVHTKGHSGIEGNEIADVMAKNSVGIALTPKQQKLYDSVFEKSQATAEKPVSKRIQPTGERRLPRVAEAMDDVSMELE